ncbi:M24 family metallopeptidase [Novosphingobium sp.]|uniref:M24 family metallopeptidase n=1 Tax=Novosphingobium sp. TaxID=1874826 RepID=UPI0031D1E612
MMLPQPQDDAALLDALNLSGPMNMAEAMAVMERWDLDAIVMGQPVNVFHALGHWPQIARTRIGQPPGTFAILSRRHPEQPLLVTSRFLHYYTFADGRAQPRDVWLYDDLTDTGDLGQNGDVPMCPDRGLAPLSPLEAHRLATSAASLKERAAYRNAGGALVAALKACGAWGGRVGWDDGVVPVVLARHDHPGEAVHAENALREIRLIKSPLEQALMARAAQANAQALAAVAQGVRAGATYRDLHALFKRETASRGNTAVFLNVDRSSSESCPYTIADGQALFLDAVSQFQGYHGDFARTVFVGEPTGAAARAADAAAFAWQAVREALRPGLRFSQIVALGQDALKRGGHDVAIGFGPHSCGLAHTDEPGQDAGGFWRKPDIELREGMVISVDCPVLDTGIGGSAHCEDLVLITADGCEPIHISTPAVIIV